MQGQRGTIGSSSETFEFDCGSTSSTAAVEQHIFWNNMRTPAENRLPDFILSPSDVNPNGNSVNHEWQNLSGWSLGEPSSGNTQNDNNNNEIKRELGLSLPINGGAMAGPRLEERHFEPTNAFSLDNVNTGPMYTCSSNSHLVPQNLNLNAGLADSGDDNAYPVEVEHPNATKSSGQLNEHIPPPIGSGSFLLPSGGSNSVFVGDTDTRQGCSLDTRRVSCKRKAVDVGQSSDGGSSSYNQHTDGSAWNTPPTQNYAGSNFNRSAPAEQVNARLGLSVGDVSSETVPESTVAASSEGFHRNFRLRINSSSQPNPLPPTTFSNGSLISNSSIPASSPILQTFHPMGNSLDLRTAPPVDAMLPQSQPLLINVPALPMSAQSLRWSGGSSSTNNHSSNSALRVDRDNQPRQGASSRMPRNILDHPVFVPANVRNAARNPTRSSSSANLSIPGNVTSSSRTAPNPPTLNPSSASAWVSRSNPHQYPRRLSEYVRRSLFSPGSEGGSSSHNYPSMRIPSTSSESRRPSSGTNPGSSPWLERSADSEFGFPYSFRSLAVGGDGSSRLVSELRNVLGLMRRGGNLRFEDVMILDHSMFSGIADMHDRHRDMRLDVDNMSYEELLALEERIGNVSTGLNEETIMKHLKQKKYSVDESGSSQSETEPCCVCQEEFKNEDDIGSLDCGHDYHTDCIKQWLMQKNLCPICKTKGLAT